MGEKVGLLLREITEVGKIEGPLLGENVGLTIEVGKIDGPLLGRLVSTTVEGLFVGAIDGFVEGALLLVTVGVTVGDIVVAMLGIGVMKTDGTGLSPSAMHAHLP